MVMSVYLILKFSSGLKGLKREGKRSEMICGVGIRERSTLIVTAFPLCSFFNRKHSNISPVNL
jgi:hypothetical protein